MRQESRIDLLKAAIKKWLELPKVSRPVIAIEVAEQIHDHGFKDVLADMGISFANTGDVHHDARMNAQKLFRWLGEYDDGIYVNFGGLWQIEQAIVKAMPEDIRSYYLNSVWSITGAHVTKSCTSDESNNYAPHLPSLLSSVIKESAEAQIAIVELSQNPSLKDLAKHKQEITESIAAFEAAHEVVVSMIEKSEKTTLKAVG